MRCWSGSPASQFLSDCVPCNCRMTRKSSVHNSLLQCSSGKSNRTEGYTSYGHSLSGSTEIFPARHRISASVPEKQCWKIVFWKDCSFPEMLRRQELPGNRKCWWELYVHRCNSRQSYRWKVKNLCPERDVFHALQVCPVCRSSEVQGRKWPSQTVHCRSGQDLDIRLQRIPDFSLHTSCTLKGRHSQRMITFFWEAKAGITWRTMETASSSLDSFFCHIRYPRGTER